MHFDGEVNLVRCVRRCVGWDRKVDIGGISFPAGFGGGKISSLFSTRGVGKELL